MTNQEICTVAHTDAQGLIDGGVDANDMETMNFMCRELSAERGLDAAANKLYTERFIGHVVNYACGGRGV